MDEHHFRLEQIKPKTSGEVGVDDGVRRGGWYGVVVTGLKLGSIFGLREGGVPWKIDNSKGVEGWEVFRIYVRDVFTVEEPLRKGLSSQGK